MRNCNLPFAFISFIISFICSCLLFAGLMSAKWDYVISQTFDTLFVLIVGTIMPISFFAGLILFIRGLYRREKHAILITIFSIPLILMTAFLGGAIFMSSVLELYKIKLGFV